MCRVWLQVVALFFSDTKGKDRFARLLAYYGKLRSHIDRTASPASAAFWGRFSKNLGTHRKTLKLFKWVTDYYKALDLLRTSGGAPSMRWALEATAAMFYVPYEFFNNVAWLRAVGMIDPKGAIRSRASDIAAKARMVAALALLARAVLNLRLEAEARAQSVERHDSGVSMTGKRPGWLDPQWIALAWALAKAVGDAAVYGQKSGLVAATTGIELSAGFVGAFGILGSVAGSVPIIVKMCPT
jgi:hypothetical protein